MCDDKLFATLDTRTRRWQLPGWGPVLLSDTVGFVRNLPHKLIASFKATLEETRQADLLLHVADASHPAVLSQIEAVYDVLGEVGIESKDTLLVLNKVDQLDANGNLLHIMSRYPGAISISAKTGTGMAELAGAVSEALSRGFSDVDVETDVSNGRMLAYLAANGEVLSQTYHGDRVTVHCRLPRRAVGRIDTSGATKVRLHQTEAQRAAAAATSADVVTDPAAQDVA